ncbi:lactonase family protein [Lentimicrobium sp. S6]|uniref:lactonase family protein n=1 Tax=Lentimicrobium sp. S6 TaxID=2735872 RepID=UPI001554C3E0|nr:lactonase family protein [Lentimicrobium sp. S6]NPD45709.1 lactonase family protein [Lentimicrobium sp. S6]
MRNLILLSLVLLMGCENTQQLNQTTSTKFYVGTYTDKDSQGIYQYELLEDGSMKNLGLMAESENPSFLAKSNNGKYLVAVNEIANEQNHGSIESYSLLEDTLILLDKKSSGGAHPCFVTVNEEGFVLAANYTGGNVALLKLHELGELEELDMQIHQGKGSTARQEAPHAHSAWFAPNQEHIIAVDLGTNELWFSKIEDNKFTPLPQQKLAMEEGAGPRHLCFHPNRKWIYVLNELHGTITLVETDKNGTYQTRSSISTLEKGFTGDNSSADIHISADGKYVYASNRGPNNIAIFKVEEKTGKLDLLSHQSTNGNWPRNFSFSPDEKYILIAHQYSNNITCFKRDAQTGLLEFVSEITAPSPVCVLF